MEEDKKKTIIDFAAVLSVGGVILYQMGWMYWEKYFEYLNIDSSFVDIPFDKMITTTWTQLAMIGLVFMSLFQQYYYTKEKINVLHNISITSALFFTLIGVLSENSNSIFYFLGFVIIYVLLVTLIGSKRVEKWEMTKNNFFYFSCIFLYVVSLFLYTYKGALDGRKTIMNYEENIEITFNDDKIICGKFITYMNDKYFIITENNNCIKETVVINNEDIHQVKFLNKKYDFKKNVLKSMFLKE